MTETIAALPVPKEHLVSPEAVNYLAAYILEEQALIPPKHAVGESQLGWALEEQLAFNVARGIEPSIAQTTRFLVLASQRAQGALIKRDKDSTLRVPSGFSNISEEVGAYLSDYYGDNPANLITAS